MQTRGDGQFGYIVCDEVEAIFRFFGYVETKILCHTEEVFIELGLRLPALEDEDLCIV